MIDRRTFVRLSLSGIAVTAAFPASPLTAAAMDKRFLFIIQRGAADGLATLAPVGDPDFARLRSLHAEESASGTKLDGLFTLHPAMVQSATLFRAGQARFAHAIASGYRDRSHFDGQNVLESGGKAPYARDDGWLNRLAGIVPKEESKALAFSASVPLVLRGNAPVTSYAPSRFSDDGNTDLMQRVSMLYAEDAQLAPLWQSALDTSGMAGTGSGNAKKGADIGKMLAGLMAGPTGARIAAVETDGWDTHSQQKARLSRQLGELDALIAAYRDGMGADWTDSLIVVATEFGRTAAINGTQGTDHGTASAMLLYGGKLGGGGKVQSDWPGLSQSALYEGRDLKPTARFENMVSDAAASHYGLDPDRVRKALFPDFA